MSRKDEYHRMGGPADNNGWPLICHVLLPGTLWAGLSHTPIAELGDIGILAHTRKGIECHLFRTKQTVYLPYPPEGAWVLDKHNHVRIGDKDGNLKLTLAPTEAS